MTPKGWLALDRWFSDNACLFYRLELQPPFLLVREIARDLGKSTVWEIVSCAVIANVCYRGDV